MVQMSLLKWNENTLNIFLSSNILECCNEVAEELQQELFLYVEEVNMILIFGQTFYVFQGYKVLTLEEISIPMEVAEKGLIQKASIVGRTALKFMTEEDREKFILDLLKHMSELQTL